MVAQTFYDYFENHDGLNVPSWERFDPFCPFSFTCARIIGQLGPVHYLEALVKRIQGDLFKCVNTKDVFRWFSILF